MPGDANKLLARMRASKAGWSQADLESLYLGFGFRYREGKRHRLYFHPKHPELFATVARQSPLAKGYIIHAIRLIERLMQMEDARD